jgi:hypothetical protein
MTSSTTWPVLLTEVQIADSGPWPRVGEKIAWPLIFYPVAEWPGEGIWPDEALCMPSWVPAPGKPDRYITGDPGLDATWWGSEPPTQPVNGMLQHGWYKTTVGPATHGTVARMRLLSLEFARAEPDKALMARVPGTAELRELFETPDHFHDVREKYPESELDRLRADSSYRMKPRDRFRMPEGLLIDLDVDR